MATAYERETMPSRVTSGSLLPPLDFLAAATTDFFAGVLRFLAATVR